MKKIIPLMVIGLLLYAGTRATAHPVHASLAEAEWNPKTKKLEVALWVQPIDLEMALRQRAKKRIDLEKSKDVDRLIQDYLKEVFVVKVGDGKPQKLIWVGKDVKIKEAWLFFEVPLEKGLEEVKFTNRLFFELYEDQVSTMTFKLGKKRKSLTFTQRKSELVLNLE